MLINIVTKDATEALLSLIERSQQGISMIGALHLRFSNLALHPSEEEMIPLLRPCVDGKQASAYFLDDGDLVITWHGAQKAVLDKLTTMICAAFSQPTPEALCSYYDIQAHGEDLRMILKRKLQSNVPKINPSAPPVATAAPANTGSALTVTDKDILAFRTEAPRRRARIRPEILIVEDQAFSRKILTAALSDQYKIHESADAETALKIYLQTAPDIVFLDIELPGMDGHQLAMLLHKIDPQSYVVMVTGNHEMDDIRRAKENAARGFIVKPYTKERIFDVIQKFQQSRR